jgi:hypothetical protein
MGRPSISLMMSLTLTSSRKIAAAAKNGASLASFSDEEDIWEPDLSAVTHLPTHQQPYVLDCSAPAVFHTAAFEIVPPDLPEVDEDVAERQRKGNQEVIQVGEVVNQEVTFQQSQAQQDPQSEEV